MYSKCIGPQFCQLPYMPCAAFVFPAFLNFDINMVLYVSNIPHDGVPAVNASNVLRYILRQLYFLSLPQGS